MGQPLRRLTPEQVEGQLAKDIAAFRHDPAGYIWYAFPWGQPGPLLHERPRRWLLDLCERIRVKMLANLGRPDHAWQVVAEAVASGHGIGKTAGECQLTLWAMSTCAETRGVATANTDNQLRTKLWPELVKWHGLAINRHWFEVTATAIFHKLHEKTWRIDAVPWSVNHLEAFQGLHNLGKRVVLLMEEASGIDDPVWETAEGAMTDKATEILWLAKGNPTRAKGRFRECWGRFRELWGVANIDSRQVEGINLDRIARWARIYGEDSQFFKVRVRGEFADADPNQLIALEWIAEARVRGAAWDWAKGDGSRPKVRVTVDVADGGEDDTVVTGAKHWHSAVGVLRQTVHRFPPGTSPILAADAAERMFLDLGGVKHTQDDFVVDGLGVGAGTVGELALRGYSVVRYVGGAQASNPKKWRCVRVQTFMATRDALRNGKTLLHPDMCEDGEAWDEFDAQLTSIRSKPGTERVEDLLTKEEQRRERATSDDWQSPDRADSFNMQLAGSAPSPLADARTRGTTVAVRSNLLGGMVT